MRYTVLQYILQSSTISIIATWYVKCKLAVELGNVLIPTDGYQHKKQRQPVETFLDMSRTS